MRQHGRKIDHAGSLIHCRGLDLGNLMSRLHIEQIEADGARFRALGSVPMADCFLGEGETQSIRREV
jgi:hypothetical protein